MGRIAVLRLGPASRWSLWLCSGALLGVGVGFTFGLTKPRVKE